jgi:hypothetical protein
LANIARVGLIGLIATAHALHWSGPSDSRQDTFTNHFTGPDVTHPWHKLAGLNMQYWSQWTQQQVRSPWQVAAAAIGSVTLVRRYRTFGLIAVTVALTGFPNQAAPRCPANQTGFSLKYPSPPYRAYRSRQTGEATRRPKKLASTRSNPRCDLTPPEFVTGDLNRPNRSSALRVS